MQTFSTTEEAVAAISSSKAPLVFISGTQSAKFTIDRPILDAILASNGGAVFRNKGEQESFSALDSGWADAKISHLNHVGRADDDALYVIAQSLCRSICDQISFTFSKRYDRNYQAVKEPIALTAADTYVLLLRTAIMSWELVHHHKPSDVFILGVVPGFNIGMHDLLVANGVKCSIIECDSNRLGILTRTAETFEARQLKNWIPVHNRNTDAGTWVADLTKTFAGKDYVLHLRSKDPVYFQSTTCLVDYFDDKDFAIIDLSIDDDVRSRFKTDATPRANCVLKRLGIEAFSLPKRPARKFKADFVRSLGNDPYAGKFEHFQLTDSFYLYGLKSLCGTLSRTVFYYDVFQQTFQSAKPSGVIVMPSRGVFARAMTEAAKTENIPTFELQGGTIADSRRFWKPNSDYILCSDPVSERTYRDFLKTPQSVIKLIGSPRLDQNVQPYKERYDRSQTSGFAIFVALQTVPIENTLEMIETCIQASADIPDCTLSIAPHPRDSQRNLGLIRAAVEKHAKTRAIETISGNSLEKLIDHDVCVTYFSFLAVEACGVGCEVVALNVTDHDWPVRLSKLGIAQEAYNAQDLRPIFRELAANKGAGIKRSISADDPARVLRDGQSLARIETLFNEGTVPPRRTPFSALIGRLKRRVSV